MEKVGFELSWETLFRVGIMAVVFYALFQLKQVLLWVVFALVISLLFEPLIGYLQKKKLPRFLASLFVYLLVFGFFALSIYLFAPLMINEINRFSEGFSMYFEKVSPGLRGLGFEAFDNLESFVALAERTLSQVAQNIFSALFSIFGGILTTIFIISLAFFLSLEERAFEKAFSLLFPLETEDMAMNLWQKCQKKVSGWFLASVLSSIFVGTLVFLMLSVLKTGYPLSLSFLAGISNLVPIVGPLLVGLLIFLIILISSPVKAGLAVIIFIIIHQIEGNLLTPVLSKKFIGLSPSLVLISLAVGGVLGGVWGAILGIPILGIAFEFLSDFLKKKKEIEAS